MYFDIKKAERVKQFIEETLVFTAGPWAGKPFILFDWEWEEVIKPLFGTLQYKDGPRQYRTCYIEIPKKNGKTEFGAAIALYMLWGDNENTPRVYSAAADIKQASLVFEPAAYMVRHNKTLFKNMKVLDAAKRIACPRNYGSYQVLSSDVKTKHGMNPSCIVFDELHSQPNDELWRVLTSGTDYARSQQLIIAMTTAGIFDKEAIWWRTHKKAEQIKKGIIDDPSFLPVIYSAEPDEDPEDEKLWKRVNPSVNQIFTLDTIKKDYARVKNDPVEYQDFKRFRCNIPIRQQCKWLPMDKWDACAGEIDEKELLGRICYGGLDASTRIDLTAFILLFPPKDDEKYIVLSFFFIPEETIIRRSKEDRVHYEIWVEKRLVYATPGNIIDHRVVKEKIVELSKLYKIEEIGYDPDDISQMANELKDDHRLTMIEVIQTYGQFNEAAQDLYSKILDAKINHGGHAVLRWCADNLVMKIGLREKVLPAKDKAIERIDGMVALMMAWQRMMFGQESIYEDRDLKVL